MTHRIPRFLLLFAGLAALPFLTACGDSAGVSPVLWKTLPHVKSAIGITNCAWDGESVCFSNDQQSVRFYPGRRKADVNGTTVWLNAPPDGSVSAGDWRVAATDLDLLLLSVLPREEGDPKRLHVMLDPGHGGEDDGASSKDPPIKEKDLTLEMALKIGARLEAAGMRVTYTRTNDVTLALDDRSRMARKSAADLFVSVHANYASNADASGVETYVLPTSGYPGTADGSRARGLQIGNRNDFHNTLLGFSIHRNLARHDNPTDRGLKRQSFFVLRETSCPAVLLELGFLSNAADSRKMLDRNWQEACAAAVSDGVLAYSRKVEALDRSVAEKRVREREANEKWRRHLAALQAQKAALAAAAATNAPARRPPPLLAAASLPAATTNSLSPALPPAGATNVSLIAACQPLAVSTNVSALSVGTLIDFYTTGHMD